MQISKKRSTQRPMARMKATQTPMVNFTDEIHSELNEMIGEMEVVEERRHV